MKSLACVRHTHLVKFAALIFLILLLLIDYTSSFSVAGDSVTEPSHNYTHFQPSYVFPYNISSNGNVVIGNQSTSVPSQNMQPASTNACYANILIGSNIPISTDY